jgi:TonB family protein
MELLRLAALDIKLASLVPPGAALLVVLLLFGLRFLRRGPRRYWLGPSFILLALVPAAVGAGLSGWFLTRGNAMTMIVGYESPLALLGLVLEAQLPLLSGLAATGIVSLVSLLLLSFSTSSAAPESPESSDRPRRGGLALTAGLAAACAVLVLLEIVAARAVPGGSPAANMLAWGVVGLALAIVVLLLACGIVLAASAPTTTPPNMARRISLGGSAAAAAFCLTAFAAGLIFVDRSLGALMADDTQFATREELAPFDDPSLLPFEVLQSPDESLPEAVEASLPPQPVRVGADVAEPQKLVHVDAVYPEAARRARVQGVVILECTISPEGRVSEVHVVKGQPLLNEAAIDAVRQWVFTPTLVDGKPVAVIMTVTVNFALS